MKLLGLEIKRTKAAPEPSPNSQIRNNNPQGPLTTYFNDYVFRKVSGDFYEVLREGIPMLDAAVRRLVSLNGTLKIIGDKKDCLDDLEDICRSIPVNDTQKGIHAFRENVWNETFEQGHARAEFIATPDMKDIAGLRVADSKFIVYRRNKDGVAEPWYRYPNATPLNIYNIPGTLIDRIINASYGQVVQIAGMNEVKLNLANTLYYSINNENTDPYGVSLFRSMEWCSQILATIQNSIKSTTERFGDPMYHAHLALKTKADNVEARRSAFEKQLKTVLDSKRQGRSGDITTAGDENSKAEIKVIGHDGQVLTFDIPLRHVLEQLVSKVGLPAWMLGIYWSTTERMATLEVESALQDAKIRQLTEVPETIRLFSAILALRGRKWKTITTDPNKPGDWGFFYETPNLHDIVAQAQAGFLNAQADMMRRGGSTAPGTAPGTVLSPATPQNPATQVPVGGPAAGVTVEINGMKFPMITAGMFTAENAEIAEKGKCTCGKVHSKLKTQNSELGMKEVTRPTPWPELDQVETDYEKELKYDWQSLKTKVFDIAGLKLPSATNQEPKDAKASFSFTDAERAAIFKALKDYLGYYDPNDPDSSVRWYYGQAYSLGLIQAANLLGKDRPLLDILKNKEIFDQLAADGFQLVKDNATSAIKDDIIAAMEDGMTQGVNPRDVASTLNQLFDDQNSDWERLARTEMSIAAEKAKVDEWDARGVDTSNAVIPGEDTHPRCRCSNSIEQVGDGWKMVFVPAPDACALCFSMQEGSKAVRSAECGVRSKNRRTSSTEGPIALKDFTKALEKIADRPINIKIEQAPVQMKLDMELKMPNTPPKKQRGVMTKDKDSGKLSFEMTEVQDAQ